MSKWWEGLQCGSSSGCWRIAGGAKELECVQFILTCAECDHTHQQKQRVTFDALCATGRERVLHQDLFLRNKFCIAVLLSSSSGTIARPSLWK